MTRTQYDEMMLILRGLPTTRYMARDIDRINKMARAHGVAMDEFIVRMAVHFQSHSTATNGTRDTLRAELMEISESGFDFRGSNDPDDARYYVSEQGGIRDKVEEDLTTRQMAKLNVIRKNYYTWKAQALR